MYYQNFTCNFLKLKFLIKTFCNKDSPRHFILSRISKVKIINELVSIFRLLEFQLKIKPDHVANFILFFTDFLEWNLVEAPGLNSQNIQLHEYEIGTNAFLRSICHHNEYLCYIIKSYISKLKICLTVGKMSIQQWLPRFFFLSLLVSMHFRIFNWVMGTCLHKIKALKNCVRLPNFLYWCTGTIYKHVCLMYILFCIDNRILYIQIEDG